MKYIAVIVLVLLLPSCITFNIQSLEETQGFKTGYSRISDEQKDSICFVSPDSKCNVENDSFFYYAIFGQQLYNLLSDSSTTLIYHWSPYCSSENCIPISLFRIYCEQNNYKCLIVSGNYDVFNTSQVINDDGKIYFINHFYYNEEYARKCERKFYDEFLLNFGLKYKNIVTKRFLILKQKEFLGAYENIEEIDDFLKNHQ